MDHLAYISFFETAARKHNELAHDALLPKGGKRNSFFLQNKDEEMQQALQSDASFPALSLYDYEGKINGRDKGNLNDVLYGSFDVRDHADVGDGFSKREQVKARCKRIGEEIIALMLHDAETSKCSPFKGMDTNSIRYNFIGPINTHEYGCQFFFNIPGKANVVNNTNIAAVFNL